MKRKVWAWTGFIILLGAIGLWAINNDAGKSSEVDINQNISPSPNLDHVTFPDINPNPSSEANVNIETPEQEVPEKDGSASSSIPNITTGTTISEQPVLQPEKEVTDVEVPITEPTPMPKPTEPPKPKPKETDKPQSPDSPPTYDEKDTRPNKPQDEPKAGDKNENGKVYFPGFGWVEPSGPSQGSKSESDGDWDKQVGIMD